jgi:ribosomal protein S8E
MWLDVMSPYNELPINIKLANLLGLKTAVYWAELMNVYARVINKFKDELMSNEGYFELDRGYITKRTTLQIEEQLEIDAGLARLEVLTHRNENDLNWVKLNIEKLCAFLVDDDIGAIRQIQKTAKLNRADQTKAKKASIRLNLIAALDEPDSDVLETYKAWITALVEVGKPITRRAVEIFQNNVNNYTDNKQIKIRIIEIATTNAYPEFAWALKIYEKDYRGGGAYVGVSQKKRNEIDPNSGF